MDSNNNDIFINTTFSSHKTTKGSKNDDNRLKSNEKKRKINNDFDDNHVKKFKSDSKEVKSAKFSSLFKNNAQIPHVAKTSADYSIKENLFSTKEFSSLNLHPHLTKCIETQFNLEKMTQIQDKTIPVILNGSDCFVKSMTGSGKTLAYAIPIVQLLQQKTPLIKRNDGIYVLVLVPTRELATQICTVFEKLCKAFIRIVPGALIGGIKKKAEKNKIRKGLNILIATPGRLCDHLDTTQTLDLGKVEYLIFDEADRMLDLDFEKKINFIIFKLNEKRKQLNKEKPQTILISATLTSGVKEIARRLNVENAVNVDAADDNEVANGGEVKEENEQAEEHIALPASLKNYFMIVPSKLRLIGLISFILNKFIYKTAKTNDTANKIIIFASTNDTVEFHEILLRIFLNHKFNLYFDDDEFSLPKSNNAKNQIEIFKLYGNLNQHERTQTLSKFCKAETGVLICTDVLARGLDVPNIDWVIQYNTPGTCFDYIHRVGRTARVGEIGNALIFLEPCEVEYINELNKYGISFKELKLDSIMECLAEEVNYYPKQINSDRLVIARNAEECANSMQFYIEEYVDKNSEVESLARKAYLSFLRSYSTYSKEWKKIFHIKNLHLGHVAKSFGLREAPKEIIEKLTTNKHYSERSNDRKHFNKDEKNFKKFNQKPFDQSGYAGLLRNHKTVDEYGSGFDTSKKLPKKVKPAPTSKKSSSSKTTIIKKKKNKLSLADRLKKSSSLKNNKNSKKRDMTIFD